MLLVKRIEGVSFSLDDTVASLIARNPELSFHVKAPMYWWVDCDFPRHGLRMPQYDQQYCFDAYGEVDEVSPYIHQIQDIIQRTKLTPRQMMQILPLSTYLEGAVELTYRQILSICENYRCGEYDYRELYNEWPMSREWTDFCETLLDIRGVREYIEKEGM